MPQEHQPGPEQHFERVGLSDPRLSEQLLAEQHDSADSAYVTWGGLALKSMDRLRARTPAGEIAAKLQEYPAALRIAQHDTLELFQLNPRLAVEAIADFERTGDDHLNQIARQAREQLAQAPGAVSPEEAEVSQGAHLITNSIVNLAPVQFEMFLRSHAERMHEQMAARQPELDENHRRFVELIREASVSGRLPITSPQLEHRLQRIRPQFVDEWINQQFDPPGSPTYGTFGLTIEEFRLITSLTPNKLWQTFVHEGLHAVAGATARVRLDENGDLITYFPDGRTLDFRDLYIREGLAITSSAGQRGPRTERFRWLDEAYVEQTNMQLAGISSDEAHYVRGRRILGYLEQQVPKQFFDKAYFEDFEPGSGNPAWGDLQRELNSQFEPRILLTLDKIIAEGPGVGAYNNAYRYLTGLKAATSQPQ